MLEKKNIVTVIVSFNPTKNLWRLVEICFTFSQNVVIVDNASKNAYEVVSPLSKQYDCLDIIYSNENKGIAWALNQGIKFALTHYNAGWILTFDQDSIPHENLITYYDYVLCNISNSLYLGILGCAFTEADTLPVYLMNQIKWKKTYTIITSGTLYKSEVFSKVGYFIEDMFIDGVDFEFSLRVAQAGLKTILVENTLIMHSLGDPILFRIGKLGISSSNHNALRRYYMARNHIIITRRYYMSFPIWILKKNIFFFLNIIKMIIVEKNRKVKIKALLKGIWDGVKNKV
jgi:rhamnosyltransferase